MKKIAAKQRPWVKLMLFVVFAAALMVFFTLDLGRFLSLPYLQARHAELESLYASDPWAAVMVFSFVDILVISLGLPGAGILTLVAGAIFGFWHGVIIVSIASTVGAILAFLSSRFLFRDWVQSKFGEKLSGINRGMERDGVFYLLFMRLNPAFPFFIVNYAMGLTAIRLTPYWLATQIGALPGTMVYVNAGTQLGRLQSLRGILDPKFFLSFVVLSFFPLFAKALLAWINNRKLYRRFRKPRFYDFDLVVIGGGSAGLVTSYISSAVRAKVALIEKYKMGGDCLNTGCVPSKALIRSARAFHDISRAQELGLKSANAQLDFRETMERVQRIITTIEPHDSIERYTKLGVECFAGEAKIRSPFEVQIGARTLTTRNIVLATGARPFVPELPGLSLLPYYTSDTVWSLRQQPKELVILGGGPIGCELAQAFQRLGTQVILVERSEQIMGREDHDVSRFILSRFRKEGVDVRTSHEALRIEQAGEQKFLVCRDQGSGDDVRIKCDALLIALGRRANTKGFGLEELGIKTTSQGTIECDEYLRTIYPNIFVCGDAAGPFQFTHVASHQAWYAAVNALFRPFRQFKADYRVIPWCTYTDPEVARVGLSERDAKEKNIPYLVSTYDISDLDRAICESAAEGYVKVLTEPGKDRILGATIVGAHGGELIAEFVLAMKYNIGLNKILGTIHVYPTFAEANKHAAGVWKRQTAPQAALKWLERFHSFRRGRST